MFTAIITEIGKYNIIFFMFINIKCFTNVKQATFYNYKIQIALNFYI